MNTLDADDRHQPNYFQANISSERTLGEGTIISIDPRIAAPKIPKRLFNLVKELGRERTLHKEELLYAKESYVHKLAVVIDGIIGKAMLDPQTVNTEAYAIATPFCLASGYLNFFSERPCGQACFAMTPVRIVECDTEDLEAELMKDPELFFEAAAHFELCAAADKVALIGRICPDTEKAKGLLSDLAQNF